MYLSESLIGIVLNPAARATDLPIYFYYFSPLRLETQAGIIAAYREIKA